MYACRFDSTSVCCWMNDGNVHLDIQIVAMLDCFVYLFIVNLLYVSRFSARKYSKFKTSYFSVTGNYFKMQFNFV